MSKYRKKPDVIDAFKLGKRPYPKWFDTAFEEGVVEWRGDTGGTVLIIKALEEDVVAYEGEHYIIKGVQGEIYSCRVDIFEQRYDEVVDS